MNIIAASVANDGAQLRIGEVTLQVPQKHIQRLQPLTTVKFGIRPEHITAGGHSESAVQMVKGTLRFMEHMGSEVYVHFTLGDIPLTARVPSDQLLDLAGKARGDQHDFGIQMDACHAFDTDSGLNLFL